MKNIIIIAFFFGFFSASAFAQIKGNEKPFNPDSVFVFQSPHKLLTLSEQQGTFTQAAALDLLFSNFGFGVGFLYQKYISDDFTLGTRFFISGARNTDEFEYYDYVSNEWVVPGKENRLYLMPLMVNARQFLFTESLHKSFKPFVSAGAGVAFILATPYEKSFFTAFSFAEWYAKPAANIGIGATIGSESKSYMSVNVDYYYIPFGGKGLESVLGHPIKDFGGVFLSLSLGGLF